MLFARQQIGAQGIYINTSGGLTGGDCLDCNITLKDDAQFTLTTQGCERVYRSVDKAIARVRNSARIEELAAFHWLPQETLFYDGGQLERSFEIDLAASASALIVEPVLFGRLAMGERDLTGGFQDRLRLRIGGTLAFEDATHFAGDISKLLDRPAVLAGARASALVVYAASGAGAFLEGVRAALNPTSGASLIQEHLLVARLIAATGHELRRMLVPIITHITAHNLPKPWRL